MKRLWPKSEINMECKWNHTDCKYLGDSCSRCLIPDKCYSPKSVKTGLRKKAKPSGPDGRMGSKFEFKNHKDNEKLVNSDMTLNSGATAKEKGDEQITGIIRIMEELKTQMPDRVKGTKSFAIKRKWLDKLHSEALNENMEFWYLKFAFDEDEVVHSGGNTYVVTEQDIIMSMVKTMIKDRKAALECDSKINLYKNKYLEEQAKTIALQAELDSIKAQKDFANIKNKIDKLFESNI